MMENDNDPRAPAPELMSEAYLSWSGFNVEGDRNSIAEVQRLVERCAALEQYLGAQANPPQSVAPAQAAEGIDPDELIEAADKLSDGQDPDSRAISNNGFFAGAHWQRKRAQAEPPQPQPIGEVVIGEGPTGGNWNVIKWREGAPPIFPGMKLYTDPLQSELTTCNCRWRGDEQVEQCTLHSAHVEAIHDWAERAKDAEAKLGLRVAQGEPPQPAAPTEPSGLDLLSTAMAFLAFDAEHLNQRYEKCAGILVTRAEASSLISAFLAKQRLAASPVAQPAAPTGGVSALRWLLNITTEFDRKDVRTRQAARLLDEYTSREGRTNREQLEELWRYLEASTVEPPPPETPK